MVGIIYYKALLILYESIQKFDVLGWCWLRLDDEWVDWCHSSLANCKQIELPDFGTLFVTGAPASYTTMESFFGGIVNCQAEWPLG